MSRPKAIPSSSSAPARSAVTAATAAGDGTASGAGPRPSGTDVHPLPRAVHLDDEVYRILAPLGVARRVRGRSPGPAQGLRLLDARHRGDGRVRPRHQAAGTGSRRPTCSTSPTSKRCCAPNVAEQPRSPAPRRRGHRRSTQHGHGPVRVDFTDRVDGPPRPSHGGVRPRLRRRQQHGRAAASARHAGPAVRPALAGRRRRHRAPASAVGGRRSRCATRPRRDLHAHQRRPVPVGVPAARRREPTTSPDRRPAPADRALDRRTNPAAELEVVRVAEYTFRAQLADRWRDRRVLPARRRRPPDPAVHRAGPGRRAARRRQPGLEARRRADRTLPETCSTPTRPNGARTPALIRLAITIGTLMTRGGRVGDVLRRLLAPRLHLVPGVGAKVLDGATPRLSTGPLVVGHRRRGLAGTLCPNFAMPGGQRFDAGTRTVRAGGKDHRGSTGRPAGRWPGAHRGGASGRRRARDCRVRGRRSSSSRLHQHRPGGALCPTRLRGSGVKSL